MKCLFIFHFQAFINNNTQNWNGKFVFMLNLILTIQKQKNYLGKLNVKVSRNKTNKNLR